jgi:aspartate oxidase
VTEERYETHDHDVLVVGAGGAGLRAAIEASAQGLSVGLVCKSLLGKAHTVMAEGGVAAAMANVDTEDTWQTHFYDTMMGGKSMNNWRMAQIHAQEAPARVRELQEWGALFDRTNPVVLPCRCPPNWTAKWTTTRRRPWWPSTGKTAVPSGPVKPPSSRWAIKCSPP